MFHSSAVSNRRPFAPSALPEFIARIGASDFPTPPVPSSLFRLVRNCALNYTRQYLSMAFAMMPVPQQFALSRAHEAFDESGALKDAKQQALVREHLTRFGPLYGSLNERLDEFVRLAVERSSR